MLAFSWASSGRSDRFDVLTRACSEHQTEVNKAADDHAKRALEKTISQWDKDYINVDQAVLYFVTLAANYLNIKDLL